MRAIVFWSILIGYLILAILIIGGGMAWPGYSHASQFISELGATGAPQGRLVSLGGFLPVGFLLSLAAVLAIFLEPRSTLRTLGFLAVLLFATGYTVAAFFPCDFGCRPASPSPSQMVHNAAGLFGYLVAAPSLLMLALAARKWPGGGWLLPLGIVCAIVSAAGFVTIETDLRGLAQRAIEGAMAAWLLAYALSIHPRADADISNT